MRVGLILYGSLNTLSGGYLYDRYFVQHLEAAGAQVEVFALPWRHYAAHLTDNWRRHWRRRLHRAQVDLWLQDELNHPSLFWLNRWLARQQPQVPRVAIVHHLRVQERHPRGLKPLYWAVERAYLRTLTAALYNSRTTQAAVTALRGAPLPGLVAYPGRDHVPPPSLTTQEIRARAHAPGPLRVLAVGNLIPRKGFHRLVAAWRHLPRGLAILDIVGRDDMAPAYARRLRAQVRAWRLTEAIRFHGRVEGDTLARLYRQAQVFALLSEYEGYGIVYAEALGFGLPVLATARGGAREILTSGREGKLLHTEEPAAVAAVLRDWATQRERLARMALAARQRYQQLPTWAESMTRAATWLLTHGGQARGTTR